jgi:uncharacterized membrane protein YccC
MMLMLVAAIPSGTALAEPNQPAPVESTLERLADVLGRLETELAALESPGAERLEEGLEQILELIHDLLAEFERPRDEEGGEGIRARIVALDLMLHRLLYVLDEIVENAQETPSQPRAKGALDDLRDWINGYIDGLTAGMEPRIAERVERAAFEMVHDLASRIAEMAKNARPDNEGRPVLARLVEQLEELLFRLDGFILHHFHKPSAQD